MFTIEETTLIQNYRELNEEGQELLEDYADTLVASDKYKKNYQSEMVNQKNA